MRIHETAADGNDGRWRHLATLVRRKPRFPENGEATMALLPRIFVLPLALGLLAGTAFKPVHAQQAQDDCPEDYHQVAP
jgi:hypothetical protein